MPPLTASASPGSPIRLALLAPAGAALFTLAWLSLGFLSPGYRLFDMVISGYSPVSQPISGLGLGVTGPWMNGAFIVCGVLVGTGLFFASLTWPRTGRPRTQRAAAALMAASGAGISLCGVFNLESVLPHLIGFLLAVGSPALGFVLAGVVLRAADPLLSRWLLAAGPLTLALLVVFMVTFDPMAASANVGFAGLTQRALVTLTLFTSVLLGYRAGSGAARRWPASETALT